MASGSLPPSVHAAMNAKCARSVDGRRDGVHALRLMNRWISASLIAGTLLVACGSSDDAGKPDSQCDTYSEGLTKKSDAGLVSVVLESSTPAPPARANNDWMVRVLDATGAPISDAEVTVTPYMPKHGHGTSVKAVVTRMGDGLYELDPVNFVMAGVWEVTIDVKLADGQTDKALFTLCIAD